MGGPDAGVSINFVAYGGEVAIDPGRLDRFFLVQAPLRGSAEIRNGRREVETTPGRAASVLSPTEPTLMRWRGCAQLILLVERGHLENLAARLFDRAPGPIVLPPALVLDRGVGAVVGRQMGELARLAEALPLSPSGDRTLDACARGVAALLVNHLLDDGTSFERRAAPGLAERALAEAEARLDGPFDFGELAAACGVSLRAVQTAVRRRYGRTLTEMVRERRLALLRARLLDSGERRAVGDLMLEAGLAHFGRAAAAYRARFGETPVETARLARTLDGTGR